MAHVSIIVDDAHLDSIGAVADELRSRGLQVDQVLGDLGIITGSVAPGQRASLEAVDGVASVDEERTFRVPPPDSPIQ